jgi:hypothetical protein
MKMTESKVKENFDELMHKIFAIDEKVSMVE